MSGRRITSAPTCSFACLRVTGSGTCAGAWRRCCSRTTTAGGARAQRSSPVEPARVSESAKAKAADKRTPDGRPAHSLTMLLADLGTLTLNHASLPGRPDSRFLLASEPTELQKRAFELLGMDPDRDAYISVTA